MRTRRGRTRAVSLVVAVALALGAGCAREPDEAVQVGKPAPGFTLPDLAGHLVSSDSLGGTPTVINFWATWCVPCLTELPVLAAVQRAGNARVVGLSIDEGGAPEVRRFVAEHRMPYPVLLADDATTLRYGVFGIPHTVVVDGRRVVVAVFSGVVEPDELAAAIRKARG